MNDPLLQILAGAESLLAEASSSLPMPPFVVATLVEKEKAKIAPKNAI